MVVKGGSDAAEVSVDSGVVMVARGLVVLPGGSVVPSTDGVLVRTITPEVVAEADEGLGVFPVWGVLPLPVELFGARELEAGVKGGGPAVAREGGLVAVLLCAAAVGVLLVTEVGSSSVFGGTFVKWVIGVLGVMLSVIGPLDIVSPDVCATVSPDV